MKLIDMRKIVKEVLVKQGWDISTRGPALAMKMYDTAVGPRVAHVWFPFQLNKDEIDVLLSGNYTSEGRNILSTHNELIPVGAATKQVIILAQNFCVCVEKAVGESYARRLLIKYGISQ